MSVPGILPLKIGAQSSSADFAPMVGFKYQDAATDIWYRLCKASAALLVNGTVTTAYSSGVPTFTVGHSTLAADPDIVGVVPASYTSGITSGNYFWVQISGAVSVIAAESVVLVKLSGTEYRLVNYSVASGQARVMSVFTTVSTTDLAGVFAFATNTAVVAAGATATAVLVGLVNKF